MQIKIIKEVEIIINKDEAINDLKMLTGIPPYNDSSNPCIGDGYYSMSLEKKYGLTIKELWKAVGFQEIQDKWDDLKRQMLSF